MVISGVLGLCARHIYLSRVLATTTSQRVPARNAGQMVLRYRQAPDPDHKANRLGMFLSSFMWFWIFWHLWHTPEELYGHFVCPDPSKWTDEELGIPPDDYIKDE
uniref:NADH dehydrogenase [ubiquinone] 1 beta subcomplex subunit 2, mitochondrial n=1 Tax=Myxine glutinosa TaxID=7769 RepID=UPI0035902E8E